jgi:hypothetical protein
VPNIGNRCRVTDAEPLDDIKEKLNRWGYLSHYPEAECDMAWLLKQLDEHEAHVERLDERLEKSDWILLLP